MKEKKIKAKRERTLKKRGITRIIYRILMTLTVLAMILSIILFLVQKNKSTEQIFTQILLCIGAMICLSIPIYMERRKKVFIPNYILILMYFFIFAHFVLGEVYRVYDTSPAFDKILHTTSGIIIAMLSFSIVSILNELPKSKLRLSPFFICIFAFCFTMTIEYLWELFEYAMDSMFNLNMQRWQDSLIDQINIPKATEMGEFLVNNPRGNGLKDSMMDMFVNIFGALAVCVYGYIGMKIKPDEWIIDKVILTDGDISALKETNPGLIVSRDIDDRKNARKPYNILRVCISSSVTKQTAVKSAAVADIRKKINTFIEDSKHQT